VTLLIRGLGLVAGVWLSIHLIAALYGVLDLWYAIGREYPRVLARIAGWSAVALLLGWLSGPDGRAGLTAGLLGFLAFYLSLYLLRRPLLRLLRAREPR
jgi:hypothetical protein